RAPAPTPIYALSLHDALPISAVDFGAYCHLVEQARQLERVHGIGPRANLRLVVLDGSVGAALDQAAAGLPGVVLDIAVVAVAAQVVHAPAYGRGGGRGPFGLQFGAAIAVDDLAVGHVVVLVAQRI